MSDSATVNRGRRKRILRLITRLNVGGPARHVVWLTEALNNEEFETCLVTGRVSPGEDDMTAFAARHSVEPVIISTMTRDITPADIVTLWKVYRLLRRFRPDVVHTHTAKAGTIGRTAGLLYRYLTPMTLLGRPRRCRFIHTYHGHIFHSYYGRLKTSLFLTIERALARLNTDRIIVLSDQQFREIHETFRVGRREQFAIVPLGIDLQAAHGDRAAGGKLRRELGIEPHETVVGIVGRLTAIKNHDLFLRVAARLGDAARFVIFGDGAERSALEQRAGSHVVFAGTRQPSGIYAATDLVALSSLNEGTPLALIEAMNNGLPIVSTAVGGVVDLLGEITEGGEYDVRERGITVASDDDAAFAKALVRMLSDRELRERLGASGRAFVEGAYSKERLIDDIRRITRELASP
jgi:glycosyltransferase involved in cell wall biosynthesis